jgi:hypothetical protein
MTAPDQYDWSNQGGCGAFGPDGLSISEANICLAPDPVTAFGDGAVSVTVKQTSGTALQGYSLIFRAGGSGSPPDFYAFLIDGNGKWRAFKVINGQAIFFTPFTSNSAIHRGLNATNTLKVVMTGSHFDLYVNAVKVGHFDDSTLTVGVPGLFGGQGVVEVWSDFEIQPAA